MCSDLTILKIPQHPWGQLLTYWGPVINKCFSNLGHSSDNGLAPNNAGILSTGPLGTNFSEILSILIQKNAFENVVCEMVAILCGPQWFPPTRLCPQLVQYAVSIAMAGGSPSGHTSAHDILPLPIPGGPDLQLATTDHRDIARLELLPKSILTHLGLNKRPTFF